ncbi:MAG: flagellar motor switch protein FliG [Candidatus Eisenbacteria bacterium]|nr:flagellar motor switch protein FliG [Candidatus Eisenbacteria bacterium]
MAPLSTAELTKRQKAAIVVMTLGPDAKPLMEKLPRSEMERLAEEILMLGEVPQNVKDEVLTEFLNELAARQAKTVSGIERASEMLEATLGKSEATEVVRRISWRSNQSLWSFARRDPEKFAELIAGEHPQTVAFLLTQIEPDVSGRVVAALPEELQPDTAWRIATMGEIVPDTAARVHAALDPVVNPKEEEKQKKRKESLGGERKTAGLLNMIPLSIQKVVMQTLTDRDPDLATRVRKMMFIFRDILLLDDRSMQRVLKEVDLKDLSLALQNADEDVKEKIFKNVSERAAVSIQEEMEYAGKVKKAEIEQARDRIIEVVRSLEEQGEVEIDRGGSADE